MHYGLSEQKQYDGGTLTHSRASTATEQLTARKEALEDQLKRVNAALEALKQNPEVERVLNLMQQASY